MTTMKIRTYSELVRLSSFEERFEYLRLNGKVGMDTFGFDRVFNQRFYKSAEWLRVKDQVITRDYGRDLGAEGYEIYGQRILVHHMNPIMLDDIKFSTEFLLNPEYLITTTHSTHNAIHYGDANLLQKDPIIRSKNDTCPWKR